MDQETDEATNPNLIGVSVDADAIEGDGGGGGGGEKGSDGGGVCDSGGGGGVVIAAIDDNGDGLPPEWIICRYYSVGLCRFGDACRFLHVESADNETDSGGNGNDDFSRRQAVDDIAFNATTTNDASTSTTTTPNIIPTDPNSWVMAPVFVPRQIQSNQNQHHHVEHDEIMIYAAENQTNSMKNTNELISNNNDDDDDDDDDVIATQNPSIKLPKSYAEVVGKRTDTKPQIRGPTGRLLCPYIRDGDANCRYPDTCGYDHGDYCDMCSTYCLHPTDPIQRKCHQNACIRQHETDMEISFAIARSKDKTCGICFEIIMEKSGREQRFGILPNCNHIFCLECIRKWRQAKQFDNKIIRACPECRVTSDFVCPSAYWVETKEEKDKLLVDYRKALGEKDCKYFKQGQGKCPFGNKCFYKHALPNGMLIDVGMPPRQERRLNHLGEVDVLQQLFLWDFMDDRDQQWLDELATILSEEGADDYDNWSAYQYYEVDNIL